MPESARSDAADYLKTTTPGAECITAALETNDPAFIRDAVGVVARSIGMSKVASQAGISRQGLYKALGPSGNPELGTIISLMPASQPRLSARPVRAKPSARRIAYKPPKHCAKPGSRQA
jgi:probable addiction module antidote protein